MKLSTIPLINTITSRLVEICMFVKNESGKIKLILNEKITREEGGVTFSSKKVTKSEVYSNYFSLFPFKKQYFLFPSIITSSNS